MKERQCTADVSASHFRNGTGAWVRRVVRAAALALVTAVLACVWFAGLPITWLRTGLRRAWRRRVFCTWSRSVLRICGVRVTVVGQPSVTPCFLVANHLGYLDIMVIAARVDATFVSMKELERWPFFGLMAQQFDTVFIDRANKRAIPDVNDELERALARSDVVVIFAEGRHTRGADVLPFRPSLLEPAARSELPISWAVLHYATGRDDPPASQSVPWVDESLARQAMVMLALSRIDARLEFGSDTLRGRDRKQLARDLHQRVSQRFEPLE